MLIGFLAGFVAGAIAAVAAGIVIINRPLPERERPIYSAIGSGPARTTGPQDAFTSVNSKLL